MFEKPLITALSCSAGPPSHSTSATMDTISAASVERLKSQLVQKQAELTATLQALEEYKEVTK